MSSQNTNQPAKPSICEIKLKSASVKKKSKSAGDVMFPWQQYAGVRAITYADRQQLRSCRSGHG
jgi:hypothetical protein